METVTEQVETLRPEAFPVHWFQRIEHVRTAVEAIVDGVGVIYPVTAPDVQRLPQLTETHPMASCRDLIHIAVMQGAGLDTIITADRDFDLYVEVRRVDPLEHNGGGASDEPSSLA